MEIEVESMEHAEALLLEGELDEIELSRHLTVFQGLTVNILYLGLNDLLDCQMLLLIPASLVRLAVHSRHQLTLPSS